MVFIGGCEYAFVAYPEEETPDDGDGGDGGDGDGGDGGTTIDSTLFSATIVPIFTSRCLDCHDTGGQDPILNADKAYNSIINGNYVNTDDAESSKLYDYVKPATTTHSWRKYSSSQAAKVLKWIKEGAKNN